MITTIIISVFILGYIAIAFEHPLKLNKAASALITGVLCWTIYILQSDSTHTVNDELLHHLGEIASILFFLLGAMTIVELIDSHDGFDIITEQIKTTSKRKLLLIVTALTFFLSALLDNLTTAIVMTSLCSKILNEKEDRLWFAGMIVIAANAGGASRKRIAMNGRAGFARLRPRHGITTRLQGCGMCSTWRLKRESSTAIRQQSWTACRCVQSNSYCRVLPFVLSLH